VRAKPPEKVLLKFLEGGAGEMRLHAAHILALFGLRSAPKFGSIRDPNQKCE
jgi:hypothetical protein